MSTETIVTLFAALCTGGAIAALITGLFSKKRMGADAAKIITEAASGVVTTVTQELARQRAANEQLIVSHAANLAARNVRHEQEMAALQTKHSEDVRALVGSHADEMEEMRRTLQLHASWDAIVRARLGDHGIDLPPAPPLLPARRFDHPIPEGTLDA